MPGRWAFPRARQAPMYGAREHPYGGKPEVLVCGVRGWRKGHDS